MALKSLAKGALLFCAGWQGAMWLFARYVESQGFYSTYGTLGGVACVMVWLYYASLVYVLAMCMVAECDLEGASKGNRGD